MAKGDPLSNHQQKIVDRYYDNLDTLALQRVQELVGEIYLAEPGPKKEKLWRTVETHLRKVGAPESQVERVLADQDVKQLAQLVTDMTGRKPGAIAPKPAAPVPTPAPAAAAPAPVAATPTPATPGTAPAFTQEDLKMAMKAFKKRLKLNKLDEESKLGRNPLTSGKGSGIVAISPPNQYPTAVWDELVKQGRLKSAGRGFYALVGNE